MSILQLTHPTLAVALKIARRQKEASMNKKVLFVYALYAGFYVGFYLYTKHKRREEAKNRVVDEDDVQIVDDDSVNDER